MAGRVNQALAASPGMTKVAQFGQFVGYFAPDDAATNFLAPYPPVEIFQVAGAQPEATVAPAAGAVRVYGPESLLTLADENLLGTGLCCSTATARASRPLGRW